MWSHRVFVRFVDDLFYVAEIRPAVRQLRFDEFEHLVHGIWVRCRLKGAVVWNGIDETAFFKQEMCSDPRTRRREPTETTSET